MRQGLVFSGHLYNQIGQSRTCAAGAPSLFVSCLYEEGNSSVETWLEQSVRSFLIDLVVPILLHFVYVWSQRKRDARTFLMRTRKNSCLLFQPGYPLSTNRAQPKTKFITKAIEEKEKKSFLLSVMGRHTWQCETCLEPSSKRQCLISRFQRPFSAQIIV
jgi:hypothetical protein